MHTVRKQNFRGCNAFEKAEQFQILKTVLEIKIFVVFLTAKY